MTFSGATVTLGPSHLRMIGVLQGLETFHWRSEVNVDARVLGKHRAVSIWLRFPSQPGNCCDTARVESRPCFTT